MNKINSDIPIPAPRRGAHMKHPFRTMSIGDSIYYNEFDAERARHSAWKLASRDPSFKFRSAKEKKGLRIWRIGVTGE